MDNLQESTIISSIPVRQLRPDDFMVNKITVYFGYDPEESVSSFDGKRYEAGYRVIVCPERATNKDDTSSGRIKKKGACKPLVHTISESSRYIKKSFDALSGSVETLRAQKNLLEKLTKEGGLEPIQRKQAS